MIRKDQNTFSWIKSFVLSDTRALDGRALAIKAMIPNWTGFSPTGSVKMLARDALYQFYDVVTQLESVCTVGDSRKSKRKGVTIEKVKCDFFTKTEQVPINLLFFIGSCGYRETKN